MENRLVDLHAHSHYSDGTLSPVQLLDLAEEKGLFALALTDHNTVAGLAEFMAAAEGRSLEAVPGVEFSTEYRGTELHILALYLKETHFSAVTALMEDFRIRKERSNEALAEALCKAGMVIDYEAIRANAGGYVNRAHIAAELTRLGYTESIRAAFKGLLAPGAGFYTPPRRMDAFDAIRFIKSLGAVAVLAHPFLNLDEEGLRGFLPEAVAAGLDGMEVLYPKYSAAETALAEEIAVEFGLLPSGGSDFHGENKPDIALGSGKGELKVPDAFRNALKARKA
jgi:predicted metal-dependent phosphoesterase TrpH